MRSTVRYYMYVFPRPRYLQYLSNLPLVHLGTRMIWLALRVKKVKG